MCLTKPIPVLVPAQLFSARIHPQPPGQTWRFKRCHQLWFNRSSPIERLCPRRELNPFILSSFKGFKPLPLPLPWAVLELKVERRFWEAAPKPVLGDSTKTSFGRQHQNQLWETAPKPGLGDSTKTRFGRQHQNQFWETAPKPVLGDNNQNQVWETAPKPILGDSTKTRFGR